MNGWRAALLRIAEVAIEAVNPVTAIRGLIRAEADALVVADRRYPWRDIDRVIVIGAGKASARMAGALEEILGDRPYEGCVVVKDGCGAPTRRIQVLEAAHPVPDDRGVNGAAAMLTLVRTAGPRDLVIACISGGGSALTPSPPEGITLADIQATTDALLRCGATINELNVVRKHLSTFHGGQLAVAAAPARTVALLLSDVVGNPLDVIASGPTVADPTTFADALAVVDRFGVADGLPRLVRRRLDDGARGAIADTPKPGDPIFDRVQTLVIADNAIAAAAATRQAQAEGFQALHLTSFVQGEAREVAKVIAGFAVDIARNGRPVGRPGLVVLGGETTVHVRGMGKGGRNQELALAAALALDGMDRVAVFALATDGSDGPTEAAGAIVDGGTIARAEAAQLSALEALANNDAYPLLAATGDLLVLGPTGTNVNDLYFAIAW